MSPAEVAPVMQALFHLPSSEQRPPRTRNVALGAVLGMLVVSLVVIGAEPAFATPANDNFPSAQLISGPSGTVSGSNVDATAQFGEPDHAGIPGGASIWYKWTAPATADIVFDTCGSNFDTLLGVYTGGTIAALVEVTSNDDSCGLRSEVGFSAVQNTTYRIAVDGRDGETGSVVLKWAAPGTTPPPANDNFVNAQVVSGRSGSVVGSNEGATAEDGEPEHVAGYSPDSSIWYKWTAPSTGDVTLDTCGSEFDTFLAVYTGDAVDNLTQVASNDDDDIQPCQSGQSILTFAATGGTVYYFAVASYDETFPNTGRVGLSWASASGGAAPADFDGNGTTDISVYRPSTGQWFVNGQSPVSFGFSSDIPVPCDFDGNGTTDIAIFRPSVGGWYIQGQPTVFYGLNGDIPVPGDYDGNGTCDIAVFRPAVGGWYIQGHPTVFYGLNGDIPVPGDYDGNGTTDVAVFRPSVGGWYVNGAPTTFFGLNGDIPVPGDYDGNGTTDIAIFRTAVGGWYRNGGPTTFLGLNGDVPEPGDYDGNGTTDIAVYRPSTGTWYASGGATTNFGLSGDVPLPLPSSIRRAFFPA